MKTNIDTTLATTGDLSLSSLRSQGLFWWLYCVSVERSGPVPMMMIERMHADADLGELSNLGLVIISGEMVEIPAAQDPIKSQGDRQKRNKDAARRRWKNKPPDVDEVASFIDENNYRVDALAFVDYYSERGWKSKGKPLANWRAAVKGWHRRILEDDRPSTDNAVW